MAERPLDWDRDDPKTLLKAHVEYVERERERVIREQGAVTLILSMIAKYAVPADRMEAFVTELRTFEDKSFERHPTQPHTAEMISDFLDLLQKARQVTR